MTDLRNTIQNKFDPSKRFPNYGDIITRISTQGFRCHSNTVVDIRSPITAFCGLNGTGKSTLLQLAATAYQSPDKESIPHFHISDFMVVGTLDPTPFTENARVEYRYWQVDRETRTTTLSRNAHSSRWSGYGRRPQRIVFFTGVGHYLPKIEQRDFVVQYAKHLDISNTTPVPDEVRSWTSTILSCGYDEIVSNTVDYSRNKSHRIGEVVSANRYGATYSEAHMGYGEGRTLYLVSSIEKLPQKSLILLEEPETSLHPGAQHQLGKYLVDVVSRKGHQIMLTTHSMFLLTALPSQSIVYLKRKTDGIEPVRNMTPVEIRSLLADGHVKALYVLVEDNCAQAILREIIRRLDPDFLRVIEIHCGERGLSADTIATIVRSLKETKVPIAGVRDGDMPAIASDNIFKLPGNLPPEKELFAHPSVRALIETTYGVRLSDFETTIVAADHHDWFNSLGQHVNHDPSVLLNEAARVYASSLPENEITTLIRLLKEATQ